VMAIVSLEFVEFVSQTVDVINEPGFGQKPIALLIGGGGAGGCRG